MYQTLPDRRHRLIGSRKKALKALLERYPLMLSESQVCVAGPSSSVGKALDSVW